MFPVLDMSYSYIDPAMFPGLDMGFINPAQHITTAGWDLADLSADDLSVDDLDDLSDV